MPLLFICFGHHLTAIATTTFTPPCWLAWVRGPMTLRGLYLLPFEEIPSEIENLFDDWGQSIPISIEVICDVADLAGTVIDVSMEPLQLEYEGVDEYTYTITIKFDQEASWRVAAASGMVPHYFVVE